MAEVVRFPGSKPSLKELIDDTLEAFPNVTAAVIVVFDGDNTGEMYETFFATKQDIAMAAARLTYLAGRTTSLRDLEEDR